MKKYMVLALCLLLLALTACGGKTAQDTEETPGDPTGSVRIVPSQEEALPQQEDVPQSGQQTAAESGTQQTEKPAAPQEPAQQPQQPAQTPAQSETEKPEEDIWYMGIDYLPSGQELVRRASTYKPEKAAQAGNDYLVSKGATLNSAIDRDDSGYEGALIWCPEAFLSGGTAYLTTKMIEAVDRALNNVYDINGVEFYCFGEKLESAGDCSYRLRVYYRDKE